RRHRCRCDARSAAGGRRCRRPRTRGRAGQQPWRDTARGAADPLPPRRAAPCRTPGDGGLPLRRPLCDVDGNGRLLDLVARPRCGARGAARGAGAMRVLAVSAMLDVDAIVAALARIGTRVDAMRDALNAADRNLGDGDTGMTLAGIVGAWQAASLRDAGDVGAAIVSLGRAAAAATGSSLGSVIAIGLRAAGREAAGRAVLDRAGLVASLDAALRAISERSGAQPGDKTVLDSLVAIHRTMADTAADAGLGTVALAAAEQALREY